MKLKTKYERMSKKEKKEVYKEYKKEKCEFVKKMERMFLFCRLGIIYSVLMFLYDFFFGKSSIAYWLDIIVFVFCLLALIKVNSTKKNILNNYVLEKEKVKKKEFKNKKNKR